MKILLITEHLPTVDNYRGPSSLGFYLLKPLMKEHEIKVITTNSNKVPSNLILKAEKSLGIKYHIIPRNLWTKFLVSHKTGFLFTPFLGNKYGYLSRYTLPSRALNIVKEYQPDLVLIYPFYLTSVVEQLKDYKIGVIGPDCAVQTINRFLSDDYAYISNRVNEWLSTFMNQLNIERKLAQLGKPVFLVGQSDANFFNMATQSKVAHFLPHPHFGVQSKEIKFSQDKLSVIISGAYDSATYTDATLMVESLMENGDKVKNYSFTFLGKSWKSLVDKLNSFCDVKYIDWVEDYCEELLKHDIQIVPISFGSGTKGKVLDAMAHGLLCIGSYYAMENIACKQKETCLIYESATEIPDILEDIFKNRLHYMEVAEKGRQYILKYHNPAFCSKVLLDTCFNGQCKYDSIVYYK